VEKGLKDEAVYQRHKRKMTINVEERKQGKKRGAIFSLLMAATPTLNASW